jgi:hypothetical protein
MKQTDSTGKKPRDDVFAASLADPATCDHDDLSRYGARVEADGMIICCCLGCGARLEADVGRDVAWTVTGRFPGGFDA